MMVSHAGRKRFSSPLRATALVVVFFFAWTLGGLAGLAQAAEVSAAQASAPSPSRKQAREDRLEALLAEIDTELTAPSVDMKTLRQQLKAKQDEIAGLEAGIRKQLDDTRKKLRDAGLPAEILERHQRFVEYYDTHLEELKDNLRALERTKDNAAFKKAADKTKAHLERTRPPGRHRPLDPKNPPHHQPKAIKREPRLAPEEFQRDFKKDKSAWRNQKRILVASAGSMTGLLLPEDLAETIEVQFTPEIQAKAEELGNDPFKIYEWVRNNIEFVPTWGSIQGAQTTLETKQGNAFDTSSLLIALLRAADIETRYVIGTVELPIDEVMNWVGGFTDPIATVNLLANSGVPVKAIYSGGVIQKVQLEHVWVEAWIDYLPSRGARHQTGQGDTWIPLDASFKQQHTAVGIDFSTAAPFDTQTFISRVTESATISEAESYATNVQCAAVSQYQDDFRSRLESFLAAEHPDATLGGALGVRELVAQEFPYLLGTLPYRTFTKGAVFSEIPASLRNTVTFELVNLDRLSANYGQTSLSKSITSPELAGKRVTLSYSPATAADEAVINNYLPNTLADGTPIRLDEYPSLLPAYLIQVKPELRIDGAVVASGLATGLGGFEQFTIRASSFGSQELMVKAGEYLGVAFGSGPIPREHLDGSIAALEATATRLKAGNPAGLTKDDVIGSFLHAGALTHLAEVDALGRTRAQVMNVVSIRMPSTSVMSLMLATTYYFGIPRGVSIAGPSTPEMGYRAAIAAKDGNGDKARQFLMLSGLDSSAVASTLQEFLLSSPESPVTAVSGAKAMKKANEQGIPLYRILPADSSIIDSRLQLNQDLKVAIRNEAGEGLSHIVPQRNVTIGAWSGTGYEAHDAGFGSNYTVLNGTPNTVQGAPWFSRSILLNLLPSTATPPQTLSSAIVTGTFIAGLRAAASGLADLPSRPAADSLNLLSTSLLYDRLGDQLGCYLDLDAPSVPTGDCMAAFLSLLCTALDTSAIVDTNTAPVANAGEDRLAGVSETIILDGSGSFDADSDPLAYQWRFTAIPEGSGATLADASSAAPSFNSDLAGLYTLELVVSDGKTSSAPDAITITAAPTIVTVPVLTGLTLSEAQTLLQSSGLATGAITTATDATLDAGRIMGQAPEAGTGIDRGSVVSLVVSTGTVADTTSPVVNVSLDRSPALYAEGVAAQVTIDASDLVGIASVELALDGTPITLASSVAIIDTTGFAAGSLHTLTATAQDFSANSATATVTFAILDPSDTTPPEVAIDSPATDAAMTAPTEITGTVTDNNLLSYTLAYAPVGTNAYTVFATGNGPVTAGVLGRLDPSLMQNGLYDVLLTAIDANGNTTTYPTRYRVTGDLKVGNFTVSFTDLEIPVAGIPVTLSRTYDSRDQTSGDFGVGWNVDIQNVKIEENRHPGEDWVQTSTGGDWPTYCLDGGGERYVAITLPNGKVEEFDLTITPQCRQFVPIDYPTISYTPRPGTTSTLQPLNVGQASVDQTANVLLDMDTLLPYNPEAYLLTTADGMAFELDQDFGIRKVTDPNGNTLTYSSSGVVHSSGKSLTFTRDQQGRITRVDAPGGQVIAYGYDQSGDLTSVTDPGGNVTRYTYNRTHGLVDVIDPLGRRAVRNEYDNSGRLTAHIDAEGNRIEYTHDIAGRQEVVKDRNGNLTVFVYDDQGRVLKKTDPKGQSTSFTYDSVGNKLSETDPLGNTTSWTYDGKKNVLSETKTLNGQAVTTSYTYNSLGKVLTTTDPLGHVTTNTYDAKGNLLTTTGPLGNVTTNTYNTQGNLRTTTDSPNHTTSYEYDGYGNLTKQTDLNGAVTTFTYDAQGNKLTETDPLGNVTRYGYDASGRLTRVTDPLGNVTRTEYDAAGNRTAEIDALGNRTTYAYDSANRLILTTYADGTTTATAYDNEGNTVSRTDQLGQATTYTYNANKQLVRTNLADGTFTTAGYDAAGRQTTRTDAAGQTSTTVYDPLGRVASQTDAEGHVVRFEYDANGNQIKQIDPNGNAVVTEYDANGQPTKVILPGGETTTTEYDAFGRKVKQIDAAGNATSYAYNEIGQLASVTDALGQVTNYEYDLNGNRTAIVDANGHRTEFAYDALGRLTRKTMPNGGVETYGYDAAGPQDAKTDAKGQTINYAYDSRGRLTTRSYPDGSTHRFSYTPAGQRATAIDQRGMTRYAYDSRNRLTRVTVPDGKTLDYTYDSIGRIASVTSLAGTIAYGYSPAGRLETVTDPQGRTTSYSYDAAGNRTGLAYPNGTQASYTYDVNNRLTSLAHQATVGQIASYAYTLGAIGNRVKIDEANGISRNYTYDTLYRLTEEQVTDPSGAQSYTNSFSYDAVGNRLSLTKTPSEAPVVSTDYTYNAADQLVSENGVTYTYDLNGSLTSKTAGSGTTTYSYDYDNRMVEISGPGGTTTYAYDVDGNRIESATGTETIKYLVDTNRSLSQVVAEYQPDGTITASYTYADDLISMTRDGQTYWYHFDGLGSTRLLTDSTGVVTDTYDYDAFGTLIARTGTTENSYLFTGQQYDANSGFYHLRARYYQPGTGRFAALDPWDGDIYAPATLHKYLYTANDPVNKVDPSGKYSLNDISLSMYIHSINLSIRFPLTAGILTTVLRTLIPAEVEMTFGPSFGNAFFHSNIAKDVTRKGLKFASEADFQKYISEMGLFRGALREVGIAKDGLLTAFQRYVPKGGRIIDFFWKGSLIEIKMSAKTIDLDQAAVFIKAAKNNGLSLHYWFLNNPAGNPIFIKLEKLAELADVKIITHYVHP
jgi:RHS repeat-associated protein